MLWAMSLPSDDDLPRPYGPGWWDRWPGDSPAGDDTPGPAVPPPPPTVRSLAEYMDAVRAAVPWLDVGAAPAHHAGRHGVAAHGLLKRLARAAAQVVAGPSPVRARPSPAPARAVSADTPAAAPPPAGRARTRC